MTIVVVVSLNGTLRNEVRRCLRLVLGIKDVPASSPELDSFKQVMVSLQLQSERQRQALDKLQSELEVQNQQLTQIRSTTSVFESIALTEIFYGRQRGPSLGFSHFAVLETSAVPDPKTSPYSDCIRTVRAAVIKTPKGGKGPAEGVQVVLGIWAFRNSKLSAESGIQTGEIISGIPIAPEQVGKQILEIQRSDLIVAPDAPFFFLAEVSMLPKGRFERKETTMLTIDSDMLMTKVGDGIREELNRLGGGTWESWIGKQETFRTVIEGYAIYTQFQVGHEKYGYHKDVYFNGLRSPLKLKRKGFGGIVRTNVDQICSFSQQLNRHGIALIYVPIPLKSIGNPNLILASKDIPEEGIVAPQWRKFILDLTDAGIKVVDLLPEYLRHSRQEHADPLYFEDHHWAPAGIEIAARQTAVHLRRYVNPEGTSRIVRIKGEMKYSFDWMPIEKTVGGYSVWRETADGLLTYTDDPDANILVFGDSNNYAVCQGLKEESTRRSIAGSIAGGIGSFNALLAFELQSTLAHGGRWLPFESGSFKAIPKGAFANKRAVVLVDMLTRSEIWEAWEVDELQAQCFEKD